MSIIMKRRILFSLMLIMLPVALVITTAGAPLAAPGGTMPKWQPAYEPLREQIQGYLAGDPATYAVYFLDLQSGRDFGINADLPIPQASTVKVPIVLYVNHLVAQGRASWADRVAYQPATDYRTGAGALQFFAGDGQTYSLRVLSNLAITLSDNVAKAMLVRHLGADNIRQFAASLGASHPNLDGGEPTTARDMAIYLQAVLRLARENPELGWRMIDDLSHTIWHVGLPGQLPPGLQVAHKEGDITGVSNDVGIVFSSHPYILCILSQGQQDIEAGFRKISEISRLVYDYQEQVYRGR
ncbi:MAG: class A beta-lactamase-related serine hydrolase [Bacillota bacterium]|nr:class A beta-lactamase-related serine hydrolase [Bacillota bacterium]